MTAMCPKGECTADCPSSPDTASWIPLPSKPYAHQELYLLVPEAEWEKGYDMKGVL